LAEFSSTSQPQAGAPRRFFEWYSTKLDTHPITTKCISAGLISSIANILAQAIAFQQDASADRTKAATNTTSVTEFWSEFRIDPGQVGRFAFLNITFVAPVLHHWYAFINKAIPGVGWREVIHRTFWGESFLVTGSQQIPFYHLPFFVIRKMSSSFRRFIFQSFWEVCGG
jgi:hypothetical protein